MAAAEQKKSYAVIKNFKGLNTKANRTAIDEEEFSWIENAQPIGFGNINDNRQLQQQIHGHPLTYSLVIQRVLVAV
jgi:hypothetical protein